MPVIGKVIMPVTVYWIINSVKNYNPHFEQEKLRPRPTQTHT